MWGDRELNRNDVEILCCSRLFRKEEIIILEKIYSDLNDLSDKGKLNEINNSLYSDFSCSFPQLDISGIELKISRFLERKRDIESVIEETKKREDIKIISFFDEMFSEYLGNIPDCPTALFARGDMSLFNSGRNIACVGSRKYSNYGKYSVEKIIPGLCEYGFNIISGLAYGIDSLSHNEALNSEGKTVAILGCGLDVVYPKSNRNLYRRIVENGLILSEYFPDEEPRKYYFPERNRIISGISRGVVVFEASIRSGSLITARCALEQNREVFAIPGPINSSFSEGTNYLIRKGAKLTSSVEDIVDEFSFVEKKSKIQKISEEVLSENELKIYNLIKKGLRNIDGIVEKSDMSISEINTVISMLSIKGIIFNSGTELKIL